MSVAGAGGVHDITKGTPPIRGVKPVGPNS